MASFKFEYVLLKMKNFSLFLSNISIQNRCSMQKMIILTKFLIPFDNSTNGSTEI